MLYHYTSPEGLLEILSKRKVWATNIRYLNDSEEFTYAAGKVKSLLKEKLSSLDNDFFLNKFLSYILWEGKDSPEVYVIAFSEMSDQLSQWRGYCPPTGSFSIGFDKKKLMAFATEQHHKLATCLYEPNIQDKLFSLLVEWAEKIISIRKEAQNFLAIIHASGGTLQ